LQAPDESPDGTVFAESRDVIKQCGVARSKQYLCRAYPRECPLIPPLGKTARASFADVTLPPAHLIHAGYSLPFCAPGDFRGVWAGIRRALAPAGIFAGQLFGLRDLAVTPSLDDEGLVTVLAAATDTVAIRGIALAPQQGGQTVACERSSSMTR
jgi:hypothetical protein